MVGGAEKSQRCSWQATVDRHFAGRIDPGDESALRAHLPGCAACRRRYDRHLLREQLTRPRLQREDRLAIGMGLPPRRGPLPGIAHWPALGFAVAAGALAIVLIARGDRPPEPGSEPGRGGTAALAPAGIPDAVADAGPTDLAPETGPEAGRR